MSSLSISLPIHTPRNSASTSLSQLRSVVVKPPSRSHSKRRTMRVMATERKDNLEHLQRAKQPTQPRQRMAQVAPVGIWDRFPTARTVQQMLDTMERVMEDPFSYPSIGDQATNNGGGGYRRGRTPWEIREGDAEYKMRFDMPGMTRKDVKVCAEENMLVVKAEKQQPPSEEEGDWSAKSYGRYSSRIALPENVEVEKIKAEVKDGVLYITIPKSKTSSKVVDIDVQ